MKFKIFILIVSAGFIFSACDDVLNVTPKSDLTVDRFWKTNRDANVGVVAIYNAFSKAMARGLWDWGELRADNFDFLEQYALDERELVENVIFIDNPAALWTSLYDVIGKANAAIKYIPDISMDSKLKDHYLGEAYAMRAWAYYYCVRTWGDVPLYLEPVEEVSQGIHRKRTDKDVIINDVIIPDLDKAYFLIDKSNTDRSRMNVGTICLLLMDVYAWNHNYVMVAKTKEERINQLDAGADDSPSNKWLYLVAGGPSFEQNWRGLFIDNPNIPTAAEVWFKVSYDQYENGIHQAMNYFAKGSSKFKVSRKLMDAYEDGDLRPTAQWVEQTSYATKFTKKFWPEGTTFSGTGTSISDNNLVVYRYADVVLLYAEALNMLGRRVESLEQYNKTRVRAGNVPVDISIITTQTQLSDSILAERQKEFVGEGKRWFDLVRAERWAEHTTLTDPAKLVFPIHRDHLNQNPELTQNFPAYPYP